MCNIGDPDSPSKHTNARVDPPQLMHLSPHTMPLPTQTMPWYTVEGSLVTHKINISPSKVAMCHAHVAHNPFCIPRGNYMYIPAHVKDEIGSPLRYSWSLASPHMPCPPSTSPTPSPYNSLKFTYCHDKFIGIAIQHKRDKYTPPWLPSLDIGREFNHSLSWLQGKKVESIKKIPEFSYCHLVV